MRALHFFAIIPQSLSWEPSTPLVQSLPPIAYYSPGKSGRRRCRRRPSPSSSLGSSCPSFLLPARSTPCRREENSRNHRRPLRYETSIGRDNNLARETRPQMSSSSPPSEYSGSVTPSKRSRRRQRASAKGSARTSKSNFGRPRPSSTMSTAVCIIPPDDAWDTIQRARHLAQDTTFFRWPPAIRLFHPFAPRGEVPGLVGKMAEWIEGEMPSGAGGDAEGGESTSPSPSAAYLESFEVTLDSILILPHWEVLEARIDALEGRGQERMLGETIQEREHRKRKAEGMKLIEEEQRRGLERKVERDRKRKVREEKERREEDGGMGMVDDDADDDDAVDYDDGDDNTMVQEQNNAEDEGKNDDDESDQTTKNGNNKFNGPCVIYLAPNDESRVLLESLREKLRVELYPGFDAFSPSSPVSPCPEKLPLKKARASAAPSASQFRPLLPVARFASVDAAVKVAKVLQRTWDPLTFNVTDVQFLSRDDDPDAGGTRGGDDGGRRPSPDEPDDAPDTRRMALTSSGEVEDVSKQGIYGCDAMVMLWGEEPEEELMEEEASLSMIVDDDICAVVDEGCDGEGGIDYDGVFVAAEREYQRMQAHEESSAGSRAGGDDPGREADNIEAWLDDDEDFDDEGATVVIGRAQFFMGAMREFVGMPASSAIDHKDRIMGGGISAVSRRKGSVHRLAESWDVGDYGKKVSDHLH